MTELTLEVTNPSDVLTLFGTRDQHLRALRSHFDVSITHRDGRIRVAGEHEDVRAATRALKAMRAMIRRGGALLPEDVDKVLAEQIAERQEKAGRRSNGLSLGESDPNGAGRESLRSSDATAEAAEIGPMKGAGLQGAGLQGAGLKGAGVKPAGFRDSGYRDSADFRAATGSGGIDIHQAGRRIRARTEGQAAYIEAIRSHDLTFCSGPAGSGKTYLAVACAVEALKEHQVRKIVLVRPAVEAGENLGFLPGDLRAKLNPYLRPLLDAINEMVDYDQARSLMEQDIVEVIPLAYMRGRTLNDSFIILDEAQNTTVPQMKMFLTRMGERSRMVVSGDVSQVDLPRGVQSGLRDAIMRLSGIDEIGMIRLQKTDIVRHRLVQRIVRAYEEQDG